MVLLGVSEGAELIFELPKLLRITLPTVHVCKTFCIGKIGFASARYGRRQTVCEAAYPLKAKNAWSGP